MEKQDSVILSQKSCSDLNDKFEQAEALLNQRIYNSQTDEKNRIIRLKSSKIFAGQVTKKAKSIIDYWLMELQPDLDFDQIKAGSYFLASNKMHQLPIKIDHLEKETVSIVWFAKDGTKFHRTLVFKQISPNYLKVYYYDFVKGLKTIDNQNRLSFKKVYLVKQKLNFQLQMNQVALKLTDNQRVQKKLYHKIQKYEKKLATDFSLTS
jgi:hypothetical protein